MRNLRDELKNQLRVIPKSVMEGGVMAAGLWKAKAEKANKLLSQPRASEIELQRALHDLQNFK